MNHARSIRSPWRLSTLLGDLLRAPLARDPEITGLSLDSRTLSAGGLFLACVGGARHGLDFLPQALQRGAAAILCEPGGDWPLARIEALAGEMAVPLLPVEGLGRQVSLLAARFYGEPGRGMKIVGITGTNGKTSCSQFLAEALQGQTRCGIVGTLGSGFPGALQPGRHTTPGPVELQSILADLRAQGARAVAMEVSSHALDQGRAAAVPFDCAVLTNLSRDHLDFHGDMDRYAAAKQRLFEQPGLRCAVLNLDDPFGWRLLEQLPARVQTVAYGLSRPARPLPGRLKGWVWACEVDPAPQGLRIRLESHWGSGELQSRLLGRFNASNLLAVLAVLLEQGMPLTQALQRLAAVRGAPGRMECFGGDGRPRVVVDYAHTPDALEQAIRALRPHTRGRLRCLFGCGGERDRGKRPLMGAIAERLCDQVMLTDDNPRGEEGGQIIAEILAGMQRPDAVLVEPDRATAIRTLIAAAQPEDLLLISGKGHETTQQCGDLRLPFSDREQVQRLLGEMDR